ncbi:CG4098 [Drosophila busckii]|uniref:CG4098 n=1 Tax=Drosophila busckii TaxID=30019 RepID=A0A0M4F0K6_DROBS|nr:ADP-ribose pyrophosphatase, mitochondrial [Drosophila busckii]ALC44687.1 CG4098 [Drosophila busckii]
MFHIYCILAPMIKALFTSALRILCLSFTVGIFAMLVKPGIFRHIICRNSVYPRSNVQRFPVPDEFVFWAENYAEYAPPFYTAPHIGGQSWADTPLPSDGAPPQWNHNDGQVNRVSFHGDYQIKDGLPQNPIGRTGLRGRGLLGRWGPNHAADPIVTRWKRDENGKVVSSSISGKKILQMVVIQRSDNKLWAIPGGMVDPGENVSVTLKREFTEEALNFSDKGNMVEQFFQHGEHIYNGYVDDFRNTDNAWMETTALNFHDENGTKVGQLQLEAGDDATNVRWTDIDARLKLHANHVDIVKEVVIKQDAHW